MKLVGYRFYEDKIYEIQFRACKNDWNCPINISTGLTALDHYSGKE